jgi:hypothetical protein
MSANTTILTNGKLVLADRPLGWLRFRADAHSFDYLASTMRLGTARDFSHD